MTTCSDTLMLLEYVTSATVTPRLIAASRSTWSEPMPAVIASLSLWALSIRSAVRYAGQNGCEMTTSASGNSRSKNELLPSLSEVTTSVCSRLSSNCLMPAERVDWVTCTPPPRGRSVARGRAPRDIRDAGSAWPEGDGHQLHTSTFVS